jgi:iron complex outermembrane receptor protein
MTKISRLRAELRCSAASSLIGGAGFAMAFGLAVPSQAAEAALAVDPSAETVAAEDDGGGNAIVVTARRRDERLQDVPLSISAISGDVVKTERLDRLQDFAQKIPNFNPYTSNPRTSALSIRGVGGINGGSDGAESGVGLIVDNVFYTYVGFAWGPLYDVAGLEVARGPQGTLLGKNTTVGAVIVRNNAPSFTPETALDVSAGNYDSLSLRGYTTGTLVEDKLAFRVSFLRDKQDGFFKNNSPQIGDSRRSTVNFTDVNRWGIRGQLLWTPTSNITNRLIVDHNETAEFNNYNGIVASPITQYNNGAPYRTYATKLAQLYGLTNLDTDPSTGDSTNPSRLYSYTTGVSNELNVDFGGVSLTSVTAYRSFRLYPRNSQGSYGLYLYSLGYDNDNKFWSQEFRLASEPGKVFDWQIGAYALKDDRESNDRIIFGRDAAGFYGTTLPASFTARVPITINPNVLDGLEYNQLGIAKTRTIAAFGQVTLHLTDWFDLTGGVRFTHEKREGSDTGSSFNGAAGLTAAEQAQQANLLRTLFGGYFSLKDKQTDNSVSWLVNPSIKVTPDLLLYASVARGVKSGAVNTVAVPVYSGTTIVGATPVITEPETSLDFEAGFKSSWANGRFTLNVNAYQNTIKNYQGNITDTSSFFDASGTNIPKAYLGNIAKVRLRGVEIESNWQITQGVQFHAAGAIVGAKYLDYTNSGATVDWQYPGGPKTLDLSGRKIPNVAPWTANVGVNFDIPAGTVAGKDVALFGFVNEALTGKTRFSDAGSTIYLGQGTYGLTNASIGLRRVDDRVTLSVWVKNLFDEKYTYNKTIGTTNAVPTWALGDLRTFGLRMTAKLD